MKKGKLIVIDGSDGSGKKTQTDFLIKHLKSRKIPFVYYDFPNYDSFFGKMVGRYLNGEFGEADEVDPYLASLFYAGDRWQVSEKIRENLNQGKVVIANRYVQSNMGFQTAKIKGQNEKQKYLKWIGELEYEIYRLPKADLVVYLYVPHLIAQTLVDQKEQRNYTNLKRDIHEKNVDYLKRVEAEYLKLAKKDSDWKLINCISNGKLRLPEDIAEEIKNLIQKSI